MKNILKYIRRFLLIAVLLVIALPLNMSSAQDPVTEETGIPPETEEVTPDSLVESATINAAFVSGPSYDSGWVSLNPDEFKTLTHGLGGDVNSYVVDMQYRGDAADGVNLRYYGGADFGTSPAPGHLANDRVGAYWRSLTTSSITVYRRPEDTYAQQVRIRIWVDASPNYNSGWVTIAPDETKALTHNIGGSADDYVVDMQFKSATSGINQRYYGGNDYGSKIEIGNPDDRVGAYWRSLTNTQIVIYRRADDTYAEQIRIRIWVRPTPTYKSAWLTINQDQAIVVTHNIGGSIDDYQVVMDFKDAGDNGINQRDFGGMDVGTTPSPGLVENNRAGAYWRSLSSTSIVIYRRPNDIYAPQIRIRIFRTWHITPPDYDSGWKSITTDGTLQLNHNLGGSVSTYMVDMQYRSSGSGINQRYYGGADFGDNIDIGYPNDRVGAYWRNLTNTSITIYRREEDIYAPEVRIRIWKMPQPDYNSGFLIKSPGTGEVLTHNLMGDRDNDYLVYFDYYNPTDGYNQRYYGGADFGSLSFSGTVNNDRTGAYWRQLTNTYISIYRRPEDTYAQQLRVRIWRVAKADYSSGWNLISANTALTLAHDLGSNPDLYLVQMYQWDTSSANALNQRHYGGADFGTLSPEDGTHTENARVGSYWRSLTDQTLVIYRRPEDTYADYLLVRIWKYDYYTYLPLILR